MLTKRNGFAKYNSRAARSSVIELDQNTAASFTCSYLLWNRLTAGRDTLNIENVGPNPTSTANHKNKRVNHF